GDRAARRCARTPCAAGHGASAAGRLRSCRRDARSVRTRPPRRRVTRGRLQPWSRRRRRQKSPPRDGGWTSSSRNLRTNGPGLRATDVHDDTLPAALTEAIPRENAPRDVPGDDGPPDVGGLEDPDALEEHAQPER